MSPHEPRPTARIVLIRRALWIGSAIVALIGGALAFQAMPPGAASPQSTQTGAGIGGAFELTGADGAKVTDQSFKGRPFAIFFGFTRCPEVCPTTLARLASLRQQLGDDGLKFDIVFVSVDPEHDKPADIASYISLFNTPIYGLTGTAEQLAVIQKAYAVYVAKVPIEGGDYTVDHTAAIFLMDADGQFTTTIDYHEDDPVALEKLKRIIA